jgi:DNA repair exonuclease SbcCD ATPase subunit
VSEVKEIIEYYENDKKILISCFNDLESVNRKIINDRDKIAKVNETINNEWNTLNRLYNESKAEKTKLALEVASQSMQIAMYQNELNKYKSTGIKIDTEINLKNQIKELQAKNKQLKENFERICLDNENYVLNDKSISKMYAELKKENEILKNEWNNLNREHNELRNTPYSKSFIIAKQLESENERLKKELEMQKSINVDNIEKFQVITDGRNKEKNQDRLVNDTLREVIDGLREKNHKLKKKYKKLKGISDEKTN